MSLLFPDRIYKHPLGDTMCIFNAVTYYIARLAITVLPC